MGGAAIFSTGGSFDFSVRLPLNATGGSGGAGGAATSGAATGGAGGNAPQTVDLLDPNPAGSANISHAIIETINGTLTIASSSITYIPIAIGGDGGNGGAGGAATSGIAAGGFGGLGGIAYDSNATSGTFNNATLVGGSGGAGGNGSSGVALGGAGGLSSAGGEARGGVASGMEVVGTYTINGGALIRGTFALPIIIGDEAGDGGAGGSAQSGNTSGGFGGIGGQALLTENNTLIFTGTTSFTGGNGGNAGSATSGTATGGAGGNSAKSGDTFFAYTSIPTITNSSATITSTELFFPVVLGGDGKFEGGDGALGGAGGAATSGIAAEAASAVREEPLSICRTART